MKKHHITILLLTLFTTGLLIVWWADYAEIPTNAELRQMSGLVLPDLRDTPVAEIRRVVILQREDDKKNEEPKRRLVFERRGEGWQLVEPLDAAADASRLETLVQNLKSLRRARDGGTIHDPPAQFELDPPHAIIRAFGSEGTTPLATLDVGKTLRDVLYVHPGGDAGIEVVDARLFKDIEKPADDWRDRDVFTLPTFQVAGFSVSGPGRALKVERSQGHWRIETPLRALADDSKVEAALAELTSLRVPAGPKGFVVDNVRDAERYGLGKDAIRIELVPVPGRGKPQVLRVGKPAPDEEDRNFAMRGDQDDVILVNSKELRNLGVDPNALRSNKVADFDPNLANFLRIEVSGRVFALSRTSHGWDLVQPSREKADDREIPALLSALRDLQTSEYLDRAKVKQPGLEPPSLVIKAWQGKLGQKLPTDPLPEPKDAPRVDLKIGRHDVLRKTVFAQVAGDPTILAIPDVFLDVLPRNEFAYRNRSIATLNPGQVQQLIIERDGQKLVLEVGGQANPNHWRMRSPVEAGANDEAVTRVLTILSHLTAERLISDHVGDGKAFGLDAPALAVTWTTPPEDSSGKGPIRDASRTLRVGSRAPNTHTYYATITDNPFVFTVDEAVVLPFHEEFRSRRVLGFPLKQVERLVLRWPDRTLTFHHHATPRGGPSDWSPAPGSETGGFDVSRANSLTSDLSRFVTRKFVQYTGPFSDATGLKSPRLTVEVFLTGMREPRILRVGNPSEGGEFFATVDSGDRGAAFLLSGTGWSDLVKPKGGGELPEDVFAPAPARP